MTGDQTHHEAELIETNAGPDALETIGTLDNGLVAVDFNNALADVIAACQETGKKGSITLKLNVIPFPRFGETAMEFKADKVKAQIPTEDYKSNLRFIGANGQVLMDDPAQPKLPDSQNWGKSLPSPIITTS